MEYNFNDNNITKATLELLNIDIFEQSKVVYEWECKNRIDFNERLTTWNGDYGMVVPIYSNLKEKITNKYLEIVTMNDKLTEKKTTQQERKIFNIEIKETLVKVISIEAKTNEQAINIIKERYDKGEIILDADCFTEVEFDVEVDNIIKINQEKHIRR